jgi:3-isopropylmalate/(R)-2-methylmalate dehydratase large subunit
MIAPDQTTFDYLEGRLYTPKADAWNTACVLENIKTDADAKFDEEINFEASTLSQ